MASIRTTFALVATLTACAGDPYDAADSSASIVAEGAYGLIVLTHEFAEPGVAVSGQLIAFDGQTRAEALHALAVPVQAWLAGARESGPCEFVDAPFEHRGHIDLLSAGPLTVTAPAPLNLEMRIEPADFPALRFALSGVVYDADAPEALPYLAGGAYQIAAPGAETGPVRAKVDAAGPIWMTHAHQDDAGLHLRWGGAGPAYVVVARDGARRTLGLVCSSANRSLTIPAGTLARLGPGAAQIVVARVARQSVEIDGLEAADAVFVSRDTTQIELRATPSSGPSSGIVRDPAEKFGGEFEASPTVTGELESSRTVEREIEENR